MNYVVTGATGFIGRHVVPHLLARHGAVVHVLVRDGSTARFEALREANAATASRLIAVRGDIAEPLCGVSEEARRELIGAEVIHLAAIYDLTADPVATERANVDGTRNVVGLAEAIMAARLHHVSSIAVAGRRRGVFTEAMFDEGQEAAGELDGAYFITKYRAEQIVRNSSLTYRIYRPGMVIGSSTTGVADRIDGPYYAFKLIQKMRDAFPQWVPFVGPEGGPLNLVPVDFVAAALDHIAHLPGRDGETFHLVDPAPLSLGDTLNTFCRAAHAPEFALRFDRRMGKLIPGNTVAMVGELPAIKRTTQQVLDAFQIPREALEYMDYPARFDAANAQEALAGSGITVPPLHTYAWRIWDHWERQLDPELPTPANIRRVVSGRVVLITGASSGIGRAFATALAESGATIIGVARNVEKLEEMRAEAEALGARVHLYPTDLSDPVACRAMVERVLADHGRVDVLVNNAGRSIRRSVVDSVDRFHDFERTMQLNYFGAVALILALLPHFKKRGSGHVINITSIGGQTYPPRFAAYVASKAALDAFSRCLAPEVKADGIHISTIHMPLVRTPMIAPTGIYKNFPTISPDEAAAMIVEALITQPHEISTRIGKFGELTHAMAPGLHNLIMSAAYHMLPDTARPKSGDGSGGGGADPAAADAPMSIEAFALTQLMRGIHL